jgi:hypothetical protein
MKSFALLLLVHAALLFSGCSGFVPSISKGRIVSPHYLAQYRGAGSLSTLWYRGSDENYHYFAHYVKVSTLYRVRRQALRVPDEFPYKSRESVFVGNAPYGRNL